jgi:methyl-accepting chemotaxis protein
MPNLNSETLLIVFVAFTGLAVLMQACVLLGIFLAVRKAVQSGKEQVDGIQTKLIPVLEISKDFMESANGLFATTKKLIDGLDPKLRVAAAEMADMSQELHEQTIRLRATADEIAEKMRRQADHVDQIATSTLNGVERLGALVNQAVDLPMRQVSGVIAAAKAVIETLRAPAPPRPRRAPQPHPATEEKDLFV